MCLANIAFAIALVFNGQGLPQPTMVAGHPLSQDDLALLLLGNSPSGKIVQMVNERGVDFKMNPDLAKKFRDIGASDALIEALEKAGSKLPTPAASAPPTAKESNPNAALTPAALPGEPAPVTKPTAQRPSLNSPATGPTKSVRVGDLLVTATRVWVPQVPSDKFHSDRFHWVAVEVTVKNVSQHVSTTHLFATLKVKPDAEYPELPWASEIGAKAPELNQMLPEEESTGGYVFQVRNGTTPVALFFGKTLSIELAGIVETESAK